MNEMTAAQWVTEYQRRIAHRRANDPNPDPNDYAYLSHQETVWYNVARQQAGV